jgi:anthranilate synthase component 1
MVQVTNRIAGTHIRSLAAIIDLLALHRVNPQRYPYLLQSVAHGPLQNGAHGADVARFDILFAFP